MLFAAFSLHPAFSFFKILYSNHFYLSIGVVDLAFVFAECHTFLNEIE